MLLPLVCGKARCLCCIYSTNSRTHTSTLTGQTWPIKQNITCEDANVCYVITSPALMVLEPAKENRRNMWEKWDIQDPVDKDALSTGAP